MDTRTFLQTVVTCPTEGYFCLAVSNGSGGWLESWFKWPSEIDKIVARADEQKDHANCYFSSYLFRAPQSTKANVLPSRTIQADLDDADIRTLPREPTALVETSPKRYQGYWVLEGPGLPLPPEQHEELSKKLTYSIPLCDRSGWPLGRKVRLPGTKNHKYLDGAKDVRVLDTAGRVYNAADFEALPDVPLFVTEHFDDSFIENPRGVEGTAGIEILEILRESGVIPVSVYIQYSQRQTDRSAALWSLMCWGFRGGLTREQVFTLARDSENNKFRDLKSRADQDLAKDVLRAEHSVKSNIQDDKQTITDIYKTAPNPLERKRAIFAIVLRALREQGEFLHAKQGMAWYIRRDLGRPVMVSSQSQYLKGLLDLQFGLNPTEPEARYCLEGIISHAYSLPQDASQSSLSYYDPQARHLLLHTGTKNVLRITASACEAVTDGAYKTIFPWLATNEGFAPDPRSELDWGHELFGNSIVDDAGRPAGSSVDHLTNMTPDQAMALLKVWLVFILFRSVARSRPILAALGQPGCLSGDTEIPVRRGEHSARTYDLSYLHWALHTKWDKGIETRVWSLKDSVVGWRPIHDVVYSGQKQTFTVEIAGQKSFRVTEDHLFLTPTGYKPLKELGAGDLVVVKGDPLGGAGSSAPYRSEVSAKYHPHARRRMVDPYGPYGFVRSARASRDAALNGLSLTDFLTVVNHDPERAAQLQYTPKELHIHHSDGDPYNDSPDNLEAKSKLEHDTHHGYSNVRNLGAWSGLYDTKLSVLLRITPHSVEDTYDIQMKDQEAPNFLVNNTVVHNSGKSVLFKKIYCLLYGPYKGIGSATGEESFDFATAYDPLYVLDNVDTWEGWLPDRLALAAGISDVTSRKKYTDGEPYTLRRQAVLGITAHNPKFGREDVADRFLMLSYKRLEHFTSESEIINNIVAKRGQLWGAIIKDVQRVLATPIPTENLPQFRIEDFAKYGLWIARGLGCEWGFRSSIEDVKTAQQNFSLEEEGLLVAGALGVANRNAKNGEVKSYTASQLWSLMEAASGDDRAFTQRYKSSVHLSKKLSSMQASLKAVVNIEQSTGPAGTKLWTITKKEKKDQNGESSNGNDAAGG